MSNSELLSIIKILGVGYNEIIIDIDLSEFSINSIEVDSSDRIILHIFTGYIDSYLYYDDLDREDQKIIYQTLYTLLYN